MSRASTLMRWLLRLAPPEWRESIAGDVEEDRARRVASGRSAGVFWVLGALGTVALSAMRLRRERRISRAPSQQPDTATKLSNLQITKSRDHQMQMVALDLRHAVRSLVAHRGYAITAILTFALGIGANVAVFNLANWLLLRPLPGVTDESRLVTVNFGGEDGSRVLTSLGDLQTLSAGVPALSSLAGYQTTAVHLAAGGATPRRVYEDVVSGRYFDALGMRMAMGRGFTVAEGTDPGLPPVAVISDRVWQRDFGADTGILGRTVSINRQPVTIVGVAAQGFYGASLNQSTDVWMPIAQFRISAPNYGPTILTNRKNRVFFGLVGRMVPGATLGLVETQLEAVRVQLSKANPDDRFFNNWHRRFFVTAGVESLPFQHKKLSESVAMLVGVAALLLLLTCANVGNLMTARAMARRSEIATRRALGASRLAVARLLIAESLLLSLTGCAVAVALAWTVARALEGTVVLQGLAPLEHAEMDWRVLGYALLVSIVVALAAGVFPAFSNARVDVNAALRESGRSLTSGRHHMRRILTAAQVAVSLTLLVGAGLLVRSMTARLAINPGFDSSRVLTFSVDPLLQQYGDRPTPFARDLIDRVRQVPGVRAAALAWLRPSFQGVGADLNFTVEGGDGKVLSSDYNNVSPGYFDALGLPLVDGREFTDADFRTKAKDDDTIVIMTESLARKTFGTASAVGRRIISATGNPTTVVGVVGDTKQRRLTDPSADMIFRPIHEDTRMWCSVIVGLGAPQEQVVPLLRKAVADVDPTLPMYDVMRVDEAIRVEFANDFLVMRLTMAFAALATLVAAIGLYGILARGVSERRREFGIRVALGATPAAVAALVTREALTVLIGGVTLGLGASVWLARYFDSRLFGVTRLDVLSFATAIGIIVIVMLASAAPAGRRAARIDAVEVIK